MRIRYKPWARKELEESKFYRENSQLAESVSKFLYKTNKKFFSREIASIVKLWLVVF